jgi:hypothetical protein
MWQFQWMISLIPDSILIWFINIILLAGLVGTLAGFFIKFIPFINQYRYPIQIISIILLVGGVYFKGGYSTEMAWREKLRIAEEKARIAEAQAVEANNKINTKIVEKVKVVKENTVVYRDRIKEVEKLIDKECKVAPEAIDIHNAAAKNVKLEKLK